MKKLISIFLVFVMLTAVLSGCGGKTASEQTGGENEAQTAEAQAAEDTEKAVENAMEAMDTLTNKEWPADKLPSELPEYSEGEIVNSGGDSATFFVKIDKTTKEALSSYADKLKALGWNVEADSRETIASKGIYEIRFNWQGEDHLQLALYTSEAGAWPADKLPTDVIPPAEGTLIGGVELIEGVPGQVWYTNYEYDGINGEKANAYMDMLVKNGWSGDSSMVGKDIEWNGKKYRATIEVYEVNENSATFTLNLMIIN